MTPDTSKQIRRLTVEDLRDLQNSIAEFSRKVDEHFTGIEKQITDINLNYARQEREHIWIVEHRDILLGSKDKIGIVADVADLKRWRELVNKVVWYVITPLLMAIGAGIVWLITNAPDL